MKHHNNFLLYSLGSASLLIVTAMLVSLDSYKREYLAANVVSVTAFVPDQSKIETLSYLQGRVFVDVNTNGVYDQNEETLPQVEVTLWKNNLRTRGVFKTVKTDQEGKYYFDEIPPGDYGVRLGQGFDLVSLNQKVQGFSHAVHFIPLSLSRGSYIVQDLDFAIKTEE